MLLQQSIHPEGVYWFKHRAEAEMSLSMFSIRAWQSIKKQS